MSLLLVNDGNTTDIRSVCSWAVEIDGRSFACIFWVIEHERPRNDAENDRNNMQYVEWIENNSNDGGGPKQRAETIQHPRCYHETFAA